MPPWPGLPERGEADGAHGVAVAAVVEVGGRDGEMPEVEARATGAAKRRDETRPAVAVSHERAARVRLSRSDAAGAAALVVVVVVVVARRGAVAVVRGEGRDGRERGAVVEEFEEPKAPDAPAAVFVPRLDEFLADLSSTRRAERLTFEGSLYHSSLRDVL